MELPYPGKGDWDAVEAFSKDNQYLAFAYCNVRARVEFGADCISAGVHVYDLDKKEIIWELIGHQASVRSIEFTAEGHQIIMTGEGEKLRDADILVWDFLEDRRVFEQSYQTTSAPYRLAAGNTAQTVAAFPFLKNQVTLWDERTWEETGGLWLREICCARFMPDGETLLVASQRGNLLLGTGKESTAEASTDVNWIVNLFVSPDGKSIYVIDSGGLLQQYGVLQETP